MAGKIKGISKWEQVEQLAKDAYAHYCIRTDYVTLNDYLLECIRHNSVLEMKRVIKGYERKTEDGS